MAQSTSVIGIDPATGAVQTYVPPKVSAVPTGGYNVVLGTVLNVPAGTTIPTGSTWALLSGTFEATADSQVQQVTVTPA